MTTTEPLAEPLDEPLDELAALPDAVPQPRALPFALATLAAVLKGRVDRRALTAQITELGLRSLPLAVLSLAFFGVILEEHAAHEARRALVSLARVGPMFVELIVREFAPVLAGLLLAARAGGGIGAEIGWMKQTEQLDALALAGGDPIREIHAPRLAAGLFASFAVTLIALLTAPLAAGLWAHLIEGVATTAFLSTALVTRVDWLTLAAKVLANGLAIPLAALRAGLRLGDGPEGVSGATSAAVVRGTLWVLLLDVVLGLVAWTQP